jgi:coenzyme F420-0:L-glutamate ligase/coenzyme F420-1:gamma-L-glutamate ligase
MSLEIHPVLGIPEIDQSVDLGALIAEACQAGDHGLQDGDVLVVTQKIVSKAEGAMVDVKRGQAALLPDDSDRSARKIRDRIKGLAGIDVAVIVSDTFGRPWRRGVTDVAIGCAGIGAIADLRGTTDALGRELMVTEVCIVDEIAAAADLVCGKAEGVPVAIVRGIDAKWLRQGSVHDEIIRDPADDLFR